MSAALERTRSNCELYCRRPDGEVAACVREQSTEENEQRDGDARLTDVHIVEMSLEIEGKSGVAEGPGRLVAKRSMLLSTEECRPCVNLDAAGQ